MRYPSYYEDIEPIVLHDPLAEFLGAVDGGKIEITYLDCVKLAGHSCPTVAGAFLMAKNGVEALYPQELPTRSGIKVELKNSEDEGVTGVTGNVIGYITGAGGAGGFKGIAGKYGRNDLIEYSAAMDGDVRLTRIDNGASVTISYDASAVPGDPGMKPLMQKLLQGNGSNEDARSFGDMWQGRTEAILLHTDPSDLITIKKDTK